MQKRKIENSKIFEAYNRLIAGESLTKVADSEGIKLDRKTLRKYIEEIVVPTLSEDEKEKFEQLMNKNYRGNSKENKRKNRNGKKNSFENSVIQLENIKKLADMGVTPGQIEELYERLKMNKRTSYVRDTFIFKYAEHLEFLLAKGFSSEEAFKLFMRRPKLFTMDSRNFQKSFGLIDKGTEGEAAEQLKKDPWIKFKLNKKPDSNQKDERGEK